MTKVAVTGGSGGAGNAVITHLVAQGYDCINLDIRAPKVALCPHEMLDLCDYEAVYAALEGVDQIVHYGGNPHPDFDHITGADRFQNNTVSVHNVFNAARQHGIKRIVWASSETVYGFPFETSVPSEIPLRETTPRQPQNSYALSKAISEDLAELMAKLYDMTIIGLRFSNVLYDDPNAHDNFQKIPSYWQDHRTRKFNLWGYVDSRDVAEATRLSLEANLSGAHVFNVVADDSIMNVDSRALLDQYFPGTKIDPSMTGHATTMSGELARKVLGFSPKHTWTSVLGVDA